MGLLHVDAHTDTADKALGEKIYHGTPFRRCVDEKLLDCKRVVQIGIRGSSMTLDPYRYSRSQVTDPSPLPPCLPSAFLSIAHSMAAMDSIGALTIKCRKCRRKAECEPRGSCGAERSEDASSRGRGGHLLLGGETSRNEPTPGTLLAWKRAGEVPTQGKWPPWFWSSHLLGRVAPR